MLFISIFVVLGASKFVYGAYPTPSGQEMDDEGIAASHQAAYLMDSEIIPIPVDEMPNDIEFTLVENRFHRYSIRARRSDNERRGVFELDFLSQRNLIIRDEDTYSAPEFVTLIMSNEREVAMGSFRTEGPSDVRWQTTRENYAESYGSLGMHHGSQFARQFGNMIILPLESNGLRMLMHRGHYRLWPTEDGRGFKMIANVFDPSVYCYDNHMAYVNALEGDALRFRARSSLVSADQDVSTVVTQEPIATSPGENYSIKFEQFSVTRDVADALEAAIIRVSGVYRDDFERSPSCHSMIDRLPTLKFTVMNTDGSDVVHIYLEPQDYITLQNGPDTFCRIDVVANDGDEQSLSVEFFRKVGLFVDYDNRRFGFCDPQ